MEDCLFDFGDGFGDFDVMGVCFGVVEGCVVVLYVFFVVEDV